MAMKECAAFDKLYIKRSTWVGGENLPRAFEKNLKAFSRREFPTFKTGVWGVFVLRDKSASTLVGETAI